jgi:hypothetical protein
VALLTVGSLNVTYSQQEVIELQGPGGSADRSRFAKQFVSHTRYTHLREYVARHHPELGRAELDGLFLKWRIVAPTPAEEERAMIVTGIGTKNKHVNHVAIATTCRRFVLEELEREGASAAGSPGIPERSRAWASLRRR